MRRSAMVLTSSIVVLLAGCAAAGPPAPGPVGDSTAPPAGASGLAAVIGSVRYTSIGVTGDAAVAAAAERTTFQVWLARQNDALTLFALGPVNITSVPVATGSATLTPDVDGLTSSAAGCASAGTPDCALDSWLGRFVARPLAVEVSGDDLRLSNSRGVVRLRRDSAGGSRIRSNGRTLLIRPATGNSEQALLKGVVGENADRCVTVGGRVLIAPDTSRLLPDGSLILGGADLPVGTRVEIGGGGTRDVDSSCGGAEADYFTVGDAPQT